MSEIDPHIEEKTGTIKKRFQQVLIIVFILISIGFVMGMWNAWTDDKDKATAKIDKAASKLTNEKFGPKEVGESLESLDDFDAQVTQARNKALREQRASDKKTAIDEARARNNIKKEGLKIPQSDPALANNPDEDLDDYDKYKKKVAEQLKLRKLEELIEVSSKKIRMEKLNEDFDLSERTRALKARNLSFPSKSSSRDSSPTNAKSLKKAELQRRRESIAARASEHSSTKQRLASVRQKTQKAQALKQRLTNGEFTASNLGELTAELRNLQTNGPALGTSQVKNTDGSRRTVGATVDKAQELGIQGVKLPTGYVIKANLGQTTISDYSNGSFKAQISQDVYDADYETILFPKGTVIDGRTVQLTNVNEPIQARGGMIVNYFVLPNGNRIDMRKSAGALDAMGISGLKDDVNYHFLAQFLGVAAYAVISSETASSTSSQFTGDTNIGGDINQNLRKQLQPLASRYLTLVPTITLNTGLPMTIYIEDEIILEPWGTIYDNLL